MRLINYILFLLSVSLTTALGLRAQDKGIRGNDGVALTGATVHTAVGEPIPNGVVLVRNGTIERVGKRNEVNFDPNLYREVELEGGHLYPGLIALNSKLGLNEIDAVRATRDFREVGEFNTHVRALIAWKADSRIIPTVRSNGILLAEATPQGGRISGASSLMHTWGWNWDDAVLRADAALHLNWPRMIVQTGWWAEPGEVQKQKSENQVKELRSFFQEARAWCSAPEVSKPAGAAGTRTDLRYAGMCPVFVGERRLAIHADFSKEIVAALNFSKEFGIKPVIYGGRDAVEVAGIIRELAHGVVLAQPHRLPYMPEDPLYGPFKQAVELQELGVTAALSIHGAWEQRNLPFMAGTVRSYGLAPMEALRTVTLNPARLMGIDRQVGSIEPGKDATLILSSGDLLDMRSSVVTRAWVQGQEIDLNDHHKELYRKYSERYGF